MAKHHAKKPKSKNKKARAPRRTVPKPTEGTAPPDVSALWSKLRSGAANVAGVSFQVAVSVLLLVDGVGDVPAVEVTPEGLEDIDCTLRDGSRVLVQVKERGAGLTTFGLGQLKSAVEHAEEAMRADPEARLIVVTDAAVPEAIKLGRSLEGVDGLETFDSEILARSSVERVGWHEVDPRAVAAIEQRHQVAGVVAALAHDRLLHELGRAAAEQRTTSSETAIHRTAADVETIVRELEATVNVASLTEAETTGVVGAVDFTRPLREDAERFLQGIDVAPGHIAAGLDFLRVDELERIFTALREDRLAIIAGPSGAGKSALLWRAAYELGGRFKLARLRGVAPDQVEILARFVRIQAPSSERPLLVCADDLGAPGFSAWNDAADVLLGIPNVYVLASVRNEDLTTALLRGRAQPVQPRLDERLAREVGAQAAGRGITLQMEVDEALGRADGLLMEFVSVLISGRRLAEVIEAQVEQRLSRERYTEREALRFVTGAHAAGLALRADALGELVDDPAGLPAALARLRDEFLVIEASSGEWTGLHELRSERVGEVLHRNPPPAREETIARLLSAFTSAAAYERLLLYAVRQDLDLDATEPALAVILKASDGAQAAAVLDALLRIDGVRHARISLHAVREEIPSADEGILFIAYSQRFAGVDFSGFPQILQLAKLLPDRPESLASRLSRALGPEHVVRMLDGLDLASATALTEALAASDWNGTLEADAAASVWSAFSGAPVPERARLLAALERIGEADATRIGGPIEERIADLGAHFRDVLAASATTDQPDQIEIKVFDTGADKAHHVEIARTAYDLCPEVDLVRIEVVGSTGELSSRLDNLLEAPRENLPNAAIDIRRNVLFREGLQRVLAAETWSQRLRAQEALVTELRELLATATQRILDPNDNNRRRGDWRKLAERANSNADRLPAQPLPPNTGSSAADPARSALKALATALLQLARELDDLEPGRYFGIASQIRDALSKLDEQSDEEVTPAWSITIRLAAEVRTLRERADGLADLLLARAEQPGVAVRRRGCETWDEAAAAFARATREQIIAGERRTLELVLAQFPHELVQLPPAAKDTWRLVADGWLVLVATDNWADVVHLALPSLDEEARSLLAHRTWVMPQSEGVLIPINALVLARENLLPLPLEEAEEIAAASRRPYIAGPTIHSIVGAVKKLVDADRAAAHARLRGMELDNDLERAEAEQLLAEAERAVAELDLPTSMRTGFSYLSGLARQELTERPPVVISEGEDWLAARGVSSIHVQLADMLIGNAVGMAAERGEIVGRPKPAG